MTTFNIFIQESDVIIGEKKFHTFKDAAKIINQKGLGQKNLFKLLRENNILDKYNQPIDKWESIGFFKVADNRFATTLISSYGINYIKKNLL